MFGFDWEWCVCFVRMIFTQTRWWCLCATGYYARRGRVFFTITFIRMSWRLFTQTSVYLNNEKGKKTFFYCDHWHSFKGLTKTLMLQSNSWFVTTLTFICFRSDDGWVYDLSQPFTRQLYGLSDVCTCECFFRSDELANLLSQPSCSHLKGFSPEKNWKQKLLT